MGLLSKFFPKRKPEWASLCSVVHTDKQKRNYYKFNDEMDMPMLRKHEIDICMMELRYGRDFDDVIQVMDSSLNQTVAGKVKPDLKAVGYLLHEIQERKKYLFDSKILFAICANTLIREDESPFKPDQTITNEKIKVFTDEIGRGGLSFFLIKNDLMKYLPFSNISILQFSQMMNQSDNQDQAVRQTIDHISAQRLANTT